MKKKAVYATRDRAESLRLAVRNLFGAEQRPLQERLLLLRLADALDRVLALLDGAREPPPDVALLAAAASELLRVMPQVSTLLPKATRPELGALSDELAAWVSALTHSEHRSGSPALVGSAPNPADEQATEQQAFPMLDAAQPVRFGANAPRRASPGQAFVARFVAYPPGGTAAAAAALDQSPTRASSFGVGIEEIRRGTQLRVAMTAPGLRVEDGSSAYQEFAWTGQLVVLEFGVQAPPKTRATSTLLKFDVSIDGVVLGRLRLPLEISRGVTATSLQQSMDSSLARSAFASYSSKDRERVLDRVATIRIMVGTDIFLDCHDLRPGEKWNQALAREIDQRDAFMLFWSRAAAASPWVTWEWQRAIGAKGLDGMQIHPLENGVEVPRQLESVHLADPYMDLRAAHLARLRASTPSTQGASE